MKKLTIITILAAASSFIYSFKNNDIQSKIDGAWISTEDYKSIIVFEDDDMRFDYLGINYISSVYKYKIIGNELIATKELDTLKYTIVNITEKELDLIYIPRGQICKYKKK